MAQQPIYVTVGRWVEFTVEWTVRLVVAAFALAIFGLAVVFVYSEHQFGWLVAMPVTLWVALGLLWPTGLSAGTRRLGRTLSKPYNALWVPYVAEPIEWVVERVFDRFVLPLVGGVLKLALHLVGWIVGIAIVVGIGWLIFAGMAALPVSIAIIIGALIIAGAVASRR